jgi:hypothetical protein
LAALDWVTSEIGKGPDVLCYNAASVGSSDLMSLKPETISTEFSISAVGTLVAGQWFSQNANKEYAAKGEWPLFLVTGGVLDKHPMPSYSSLSAV